MAANSLHLAASARSLLFSTVLLAAGLAACAGEEKAAFPDAGADAADLGPIEVSLVAPATEAAHVRDFVGAHGALVARVELQVVASGPYSRIALVTDTGAPLGDPGPDLFLPAEFADDGPVTVTVQAYDQDGEVAATDAVALIIAAPTAETCYDWLDLYQLDYTLGPNNPGVPMPVTVTTPINGVSYRYVSSETPRASLFMDCELALALAQSASSLRQRDVIEVADIGVYNYRCIGGVGTPPDCPQGISQHAYARGIDIAGYTTGDGEYFSVLTDWIIDPDTEETCSAATEPGKDRFLHEVICQQKDEDVWHIALTPNYNDAHRNHFHVDRTPGSDFISRIGGAIAIDEGPDDH